MPKVYAARKECGHIVAVFPISLDSKAKAEIARQLIAAGVDITQVDESEVSLWFALSCDCLNKQPSLLTMADQYRDAKILMDELGEVPSTAAIQRRLRCGYTTALNIREKLLEDTVPAEAPAESAPEPQPEAPAEEAKPEEAPADTEAAVDHKAEADELLNNFLEKKDDPSSEEDPDETTDEE